jgi:hypothetical protein
LPRADFTFDKERNVCVCPQGAEAHSRDRMKDHERED